MFKFLKDKLKSAISKISEGVEKEGKTEEIEVEKQIEKKEPEAEVKKGFFAKIKEKFAGKDEISEERKGTIVETPEEITKRQDVKIQFQEKPEIELKAKEEHVITKEAKTEKIKGEIKVTKHEEHVKKEGKTALEKPITGAAKETKKDSTKIKDVPKFVKQEIRKPEVTQIKVEIKEEIRPETKKEEKKYEEGINPKITEEPEKKGFFAKLTEKIITTKINEGQFEKLFWEMELALMENNVAVEVIEKIKNDMKEQLVEKPIRRNKVEETIVLTLRSSIQGLFQSNGINLIDEIKNKKEKPYVIAFLFYFLFHQSN